MRITNNAIFQMLRRNAAKHHVCRSAEQDGPRAPVQWAVTVGFPTVQQWNRVHREYGSRWCVNHRCDRRMCYWALIFVTPSVSTIQWNLEKSACDSTEGSARPLTEKISCQVRHKSAFFTGVWTSGTLWVQGARVQYPTLMVLGGGGG